MNRNSITYPSLIYDEHAFPNKSFIFVNDGRHITLSGAKSPKVWVTLAMSGIDEDFSTPRRESGVRGVGRLTKGGLVSVHHCRLYRTVVHVHPLGRYAEP